MKPSSYVESNDFVKVDDWKARSFPIDSVIPSHSKLIYECADISRGLFCMLEFGRSVLPRTIFVKQLIHFKESFRFFL